MMKLTIFKRLVAGFLLILIVVVALGAYAFLKFRELNQISDSISSISSIGKTIRIIDNLKDNLDAQRKLEQRYLVLEDKNYFSGTFLEKEKSIQKDLDEMDILLASTKNKNMASRIKEAYNLYLEKVQEEVNLINQKEKYSKDAFEEKKDAFEEKNEVLIDVVRQQLYLLNNSIEEEVDQKINISTEISLQALKVILILTTVSIIMAVLIAFYNSQTIHHPILLMIKETKEIAKGKFEKHLNISSPPEINELAQAFNHMVDRLKELDEMKADLIANVSHEFRTPLAVIREAISLYMESIDTAPREKQNKLLGIVQEECERLIESVNKVLNLSRMDAGIIDYQMENYNISHLIAIAVSKIQPIATRKQISLEVNVANDSLNTIMDPDKIGQVFDNLLGNALKFTPEKGKISIGATLGTATRERYSEDDKKDVIVVSVSDTGPGIPKENIHDIFDKYKKLHEKGTGLGLYIARQIINAHGGDIWVESNGKTGSTFFFTVPVS